MAIWISAFIVAAFAASLLFLASHFPLWLLAYFTGTRIGLLDLALMSLRKSNPKTIVQCKVMAAQSGLTAISTKDIETLYLAGGDVRRVMLALIAADRASIDLDWNTAAAIDLAGRDVMEAVRVSINPKVIDCPNPQDGGSDMLYGVARDGIQIKVRLRVTVRTNLAQLIGGATEATIIARVGQSIISSIGACDTYREALSDPQIITRIVQAKQLDAQTAFAIVSIDVADIDVGENIGAKLQHDQANADIRIARAAAETRRAMAVARQQEMQAEVAMSQAALVLAYAAIPAALATAFRAGTLHTQALPVQTNANNDTAESAIDPLALERRSWGTFFGIHDN
ncbi:MAG: flotillin-like FloA family protein [Planctomycetales bacterium]|nr:flotillin-like FloA family protein [Planctomycetales bacterium]